jgi:ribosome-associated protein
MSKSTKTPTRAKSKAPAKRKAVAKAPAKAAAKPAANGKPARKQPAKAAARVLDRGEVLTRLSVSALEDLKAQNLRVIDVRGRMDVADTLIIASGTSDRHVRSLAANVVDQAKKAGLRPYGVEGERSGEWVLVDLHEVIVHVMLPAVREFYAIEKLWESPANAAPKG